VEDVAAKALEAPEASEFRLAPVPQEHKLADDVIDGMSDEERATLLERLQNS
jgi:hypothetical protein